LSGTVDSYPVHTRPSPIYERSGATLIVSEDRFTRLTYGE